MKKLKIAFILSEYGLPIPAEMGGAIETLLTMLLEQNEIEGRFDFLFISPGNKEEKTELDHAICYSCIPDVTAKKKRPVPILMQKIEYKLQQYFPGIFIKVSRYYKSACGIAKQNKADYVIAEGVMHEQFIRFLRIWEREKMATHLHHQCSKTILCDIIFGKSIAISKYIADKWNENTQEQEKNTFILKNCIDNKKFDILLSSEQRLKIRKMAGFGADDFVVLFCGRIVAEKGVRELIDAVTGISDTRVKLLIIGSDSFARGNKGQYAEDIEKLVAQNKERVIHLGYVDNGLLYQYYQSADVQVVPSIWEEPAGLVVLEGMMSRVPLIITHSGGMIEYVNDEYTKIIPKDEHLVENIREHILALMNDPDECQRMTDGAYEWAKQFSKQKYYADFCDIMDEWRKEIVKEVNGF